MSKILTVLILFNLLGAHETLKAQEEQVEDEQFERIILITSRDCLLLNRHVPDADVKYKPDVDVRGRNTVPAEVRSARGLNLGQNGYSFYMTHDALKGNEIAQRFGVEDSNEGKIILGQVTVQDGEVLWNGSPLQGADQDSVYLLCDQERRKKRRPVVKR